MRNYKITKCKLESLKPGDKVLSKEYTDGGWYSFTFIGDGDLGLLRFSGGEIKIETTVFPDKEFYYFDGGALFYKVEDDFPDIWDYSSIDHLNLNI